MMSLNRLERLTNDVNQVKGVLLGCYHYHQLQNLSLDVELKDWIILTELYFDALRGGVDLARDPRVQEVIAEGNSKRNNAKASFSSTKKRMTRCKVMHSRWQIQNFELNREL